MSDEDPDRVRQEQIVRAILTVLGVALAIGAVIAIGSLLLINTFGLNDVDSGPGVIRAERPTPSSLPTVAIPQTPGSTPSPTETETIEPEPTFAANPGNDDLFLNASPLTVGPMERINLTGQWPGKDAVSLLVQRFEDGEWVDFGVQVQVKIGTFETYVETSHEGGNKFRVFDPSSDTASNAVVVNVEG